MTLNCGIKGELINSISQLEDRLHHPVVLLFTPSLPDYSTEITYQAEYLFAKHLLCIKKKLGLNSELKLPGLTLALSTQGGNYTTVINLMKLARENVETINVLVLDKALSAGSLLALLADTITAVPGARFSPFSPMVSNFLNQKQRVIGSDDIEQILESSISFAEKAALLNKLYSEVDPIMIMQVMRARKLISKVLTTHLTQNSYSESEAERINDLFLNSNTAHTTLFCLKELIDAKIRIQECPRDVTSIASSILQQANAFSLPFSSQEIIRKYRSEAIDSFSFTLRSLMLGSKYLGVSSLSNDVITCYCGPKEKVNLANVAIQTSPLYLQEE